MLMSSSWMDGKMHVCHLQCSSLLFRHIHLLPLHHFTKVDASAMAGTLPALIARILSLPFSLVGLVLARILGVRRLPSSLRLSGGWSSDGDSSSGASAAGGSDSDAAIIDPVVAAQWFLRYIKTCDPDPDGQGIDSSLWFTKGGYNAALRRAKEECQVLCVVLTSREHDDNAAFLRWAVFAMPTGCS